MPTRRRPRSSWSASLALAVVGVGIGAAPAPAVPPNDLCTSAQFIPLPGQGTFAVTGTTVGSTSDLPSSGCPTADSDVDDVWYRFVPPVSGFYRVSTAGSQFDTTLSLWTGACDDLFIGGDLACNDDEDPVFIFTSLLLVQLTAGVEVKARVAGNFNITAPLSIGVTVPAGAPPTGACCTGGSCAPGALGTCAGTFLGPGTTCGVTPCPGAGVCCRGSVCSASITQAQCTPLGQAGAMFAGAGACNAAGDDQAPCCKADYNKAGGVELLDIFAFLQDWFNLAAPSDFNAQNGVDLLDIFAFLQAWFNGGC